MHAAPSFGKREGGRDRIGETVIRSLGLIDDPEFQPGPPSLLGPTGSFASSSPCARNTAIRFTALPPPI